MDKEIGQCSLCGGSVTVPSVWCGIKPPVPTCQSCGATARASGPVIPMNPPRQPQRLKDWKEMLNHRDSRKVSDYLAFEQKGSGNRAIGKP